MRQYRALVRRTWICVQCRANSSVASPNGLRASSKPKSGLPSEPARTRFAPSPTGYLHLGSLRTALFNYLLAKRTGGQFLLRIEDTDQKRTIPGAEERLYEDLQWTGLQWDEGPNVGGPYGPYRQSERTALYQSHANDLITSGHAYRCFCSVERLDALNRQRNQAGLPLGYDRTCFDISAEESAERAAKGEPYVVRLKADQYPMFEDLVYGKTGQNRAGKKQLELIDRVYDDPILLKSDGHPTYHLANVVDDHHMKITHVIRGTEWMASTPLHVALYNAFQWTPPQFGHVPLLVDRNGQKLSKRNADIDISIFRDRDGIIPDALVNFAALLGWSHTQKSDVFTLGELENIFNLKITKGNATVVFDKLWFLQKAHAQRCAAQGGPAFESLVERTTKVAEQKWSQEQLNQILQGRSLSWLVADLLRADAKSFTTPDEFLTRNKTFFTTNIERPPYIPTTTTTTSTTDDPLSALHTLSAALTLVPESHWTADAHRANITDYLNATTENKSKEEKKALTKEMYHYLRWALSGGASGPGIPETMVILGRAETVRRLTDAREATKKSWKKYSLPGVAKGSEGSGEKV